MIIEITILFNNIEFDLVKNMKVNEKLINQSIGSHVHTPHFFLNIKWYMLFILQD